MTAAPNGASRVRAARRSTEKRRARPGNDAGCASPAAPSARPDPGIDPAIQDVDDQVAQDEADRDQQHDSLHERIVAREYGVDHEAPDPRQREDVLGDDGAADQGAELQPE